MSADSITTNSGIYMRTELLFGEENLRKLQDTRVLIFGIGGVGSWIAEALVRSGICHLTIVDSDRVSASNCNRQLMATSRTVGQVKVEALRERLLEINPEAQITAIEKVYDASTSDEFEMEQYDFIVDAIDSLSAKAHLILRATSLPRSITFISSMGAALRYDPFKVREAEFWEVTGDPLARALRKKFKKQGTFPGRKFTCIYSEELPMENMGRNAETGAESIPNGTKAQINGSLCHITAIFGMSIAGLIIERVVTSRP